VWWLPPIVATGLLSGRPCLDPAVADAGITAFDGERHIACFGDPTFQECVRFDARGVVERVPAVDDGSPSVAPSKPFTVVRGDDDHLKVCPSVTDACIDVPSHYPGDHYVQPLDVTPDARRMLVLDGVPLSDDRIQLYVDVLAIPSGRRLRRFSYEGIGSSDMTIVHVGHFSGDNIVIGDSPAGPTRYHLIEPRSRRSLELYDDMSAMLDYDDRITIVSDDLELRIVDRISVRALATITLPGKEPGPRHDEPNAFATKVGSKTVVVTAGPAAVIPFDVVHRRLGAPRPFAICR